MVLTVRVRVLSTPAEEYEVTVKYQVPEDRSVTVYAVKPGFVTLILCVRLSGDVP